MDDTIPLEILFQFSLFLGSEHDSLKNILSGEKFEKLNNLITSIISINSVKHNTNNSTLIEINPRRKLSLIINEADLRDLIKDLFLNSKNSDSNYYELWIYHNKKKV